MSDSIESISNGPRQSNFELLRIIAMLLVLIVHADFKAIGGPNYQDFLNDSSNALIRIFFESASIVCVNVFIMISGWFGIRPSLKGLFNFIFQCVYFYLGIYIFSLYLGYSDFSLKSICTAFCLTGDTGWFIKAYIFLYIIAPILNAFIEKSSKKNILIFLYLFYFFQTIYTLTIATDYLAYGYNPLSFMGLYILASYLKKYGINLRKYGLTIYIVSIFLLCFLFILVSKFKIQYNVYQYSNPIVVSGSMGLILWGSNLMMKTNKFINYISASAFSVYLFHLCPTAPNFYLKICKQIYYNFNGLSCLLHLTFIIILTFIIAIILDQPRKILWHQFTKLINNSTKLHFISNRW